MLNRATASPRMGRPHPRRVVHEALSREPEGLPAEANGWPGMGWGWRPHMHLPTEDLGELGELSAQAENG